MLISGIEPWMLTMVPYFSVTVTGAPVLKNI